MTQEPEVLWSPPADIRERSRIGAYLGRLERRRSLAFADYGALWHWSVDEIGAFWSSIAEEFEVDLGAAPGPALAERRMPGASWFPGAVVSYPRHALRLPDRGDQDEVIVSVSQARPTVRLTAVELREAVARARAGLTRLGVAPGHRVAGYLPNTWETVAAFLATASMGAIWTSCAPEFGARSVIDRLGQIEPTVLLVVDGYRYGSKLIDRRAEVEAIRRALPSLRATVVVPYLDADASAAIPDSVAWDDLLAEPGDLSFEPVPFDHPLYVLYSSGTTGLPKAIVHGHGGILLEHLKALALHTDLGPGDRFSWFTTTGWMMWNYLVSGLAVGSTIVLFDGDPGYPDLGALWRLADEEQLTYLGLSAPYLMACRKTGLTPGRDHDLSHLRGLGSTGAPLPAEGFRWVYDAVGRDLILGSLSGGTDLCTGFLGPVPLLPVRAGEITCRMLGASVEAYDESGTPVTGRQGELVITQPMPSMPTGLWGDADGSRYRAAYFADFPGVWRHGDWITVTERGSCIITGRSDATLKRGGVRLGTAEFYALVESQPEIADSLVVHLEDPDGGPGELLLFVALRPGHELDEPLRQRIVRELRTSLSPRHVPDEIITVPAIPRTLSGKKLEVPVKRILGGTPPDEAASRGSLADPAALDVFERFAAERTSRRAAQGPGVDAPGPRPERTPQSPPR